MAKALEPQGNLEEVFQKVMGLRTVEDFQRQDLLALQRGCLGCTSSQGPLQSKSEVLRLGQDHLLKGLPQSFSSNDVYPEYLEGSGLAMRESFKAL